MAMSKLDVLAVGAHPDDVELGCGGTLALLAAQGRRVGIVHLTRGERGTRGTAAEREDEARRAAAALGAVELSFLDCGDGALRTGEAEEDALIGVLRAFRPDLVIGPTPHDRHPDHSRAHALVEAACFYSGLTNRAADRGPAFRPAAVFSYMQHDEFPVRFIVDVTSSWAAKVASLDAYRSQIFQEKKDEKDIKDIKDGKDKETVTKVSTPQFRLAIEGRARHFGEMINAELGEPFWSRTPLAVRDLMTLLPGGVR
jgi:bacillithiol biosynthesis deacetylase BshB1